jgi:hypothetical protein
MFAILPLDALHFSLCKKERKSKKGRENEGNTVTIGFQMSDHGSISLLEFDLC